jgi:hypothetical protein
VLSLGQQASGRFNIWLTAEHLYMILSRNSFFIFLFILFILPLPLYKLIWVATSKETTGTIYFTGHGNLGSVFGISTYPVIRMKVKSDTIYFNGNVNIPLKPDEKVSVRYQRNDVTDAKINMFTCIWGDTLAYEIGPFLIFLVIFFHPDLVPKNARIILGRKPLIRMT